MGSEARQARKRESDCEGEREEGGGFHSFIDNFTKLFFNRVVADCHRRGGRG